MPLQSRVHVVEDDEPFCRLLLEALSRYGFDCRGFRSAEAFMEAYSPGVSECLITDMELPGISGLELLEHAATHYPSLSTILLTGHASVQAAVEALKKGAFDFLLKPVEMDLLAERVRQAIDQNHVQLLTEREVRDLYSRLRSLSERELTILRFLAPGHRVKTIAHCLGISEKTVEFHRHNIFNKTGVRNPGALIYRIGLLRGYHVYAADELLRLDPDRDFFEPMMNCPGAAEPDGCIQGTSLRDHTEPGFDKSTASINTRALELAEFAENCRYCSEHTCVAKVLIANLSFLIRAQSPHRGA